MTEVIELEVVRVFTDGNGEHGNPLGIVRSSAVTRGSDQRIATRLGFSETVFIDTVDVEGRAARIRIFTPATELQFAGHPSVGTAWWLAEEGTPVTVLHEAAGEVAVDAEGEFTWVSARAAWAPEFEWIPLARPAEVDAIDPLRFVDGHHYAYAWIDEDAGYLRSRMFAPSMGIAEDEATGSAAVRVTAKLGRDLRIRQGLGSELRTQLVGGDLVRVGGRTVGDGAMTLAL